MLYCLAQKGILRGFSTEFNARQERLEDNTRIIERAALARTWASRPAKHIPQSVITESSGKRGRIIRKSHFTMTPIYTSPILEKSESRDSAPELSPMHLRSQTREITLTLGRR